MALVLRIQISINFGGYFQKIKLNIKFEELLLNYYSSVLSFIFYLLFYERFGHVASVITVSIEVLFLSTSPFLSDI